MVEGGKGGGLGLRGHILLRRLLLLPPLGKVLVVVRAGVEPGNGEWAGCSLRGCAGPRPDRGLRCGC